MTATIVLAHGIARFDELLVLAGREKGVYFKGIADRLRGEGLRVVETSVAFADSVDVRSRELWQQIRDLGPVHIIAHSMGGLDARRMIVDNPDAAAAVKSLTTIGTPHNGTAFADFGLQNAGNAVVELFRKMSWPSLDGFRDLSTASCRKFNDDARAKENANGVKYRVVSASEAVLKVVLPLQPSFAIIAEREGANDGLVSVASQQWHAHGLSKTVEVIPFPLAADHLNEVGWWHPGKGLFSWFTYERTIKNFYLERAQRALQQG